MSIDLQYIFDAVPGLFLAVAPDSPRFTILAVTDAYLNATKTQRSVIIGQALFDVFPDNPDTPEATATRNTRESLERAIQKRVPDTMVVQRHDIRRSIAEGEDFEERYWSSVNTPVLDKTGKVVYLIHHVEEVTENERLKQKGDEQQALTDNLLRDITEHKRTEEMLRQQSETALRLSEQEFRSFAEAMPQIVWATRPDGWNVYFNQQWVDYTGMTIEESYGHGWNAPFHPDDKQRAWDAWQRATQHNERYSLECRLRRADGVYRWWLIRGEPTRDENGEIKKWFGTCTDIEELKRSEAMLSEAKNLLEQRVDERTKALKEIEEQFSVLIQNLQSAVALVNELGAFTIVNQAFLRIFELNDDSNIKNVNDRDWSEWQVFDDHGTLLDLDEHPVRKAALKGRPVRDQLVAVKAPANPKIKWLLVSAEPILDSQGHIYRLICTYHDFTERKQAEIALRAREADLIEAQQLAHLGSWHWDAKTDVTTGSHELLRIYGFDPATQTMPNFKEQRGRCYPVEDWEQVNAAVQRSLETGVGYELDVRVIRNDAAFWVTTRGEAVRDANGRMLGLRGTVQDIDERKQAEESVLRSEEQLRRAQEIAHLGSWNLDLIENRLTWSDEVYRIFGLQPQEFSATYETFLDRVHPDDRAKVDEAYSGSLRENLDIYEIEHRIVRKDDGKIRIVHERCQHFRDATSKIVRSGGMVHDITARKQADEQIKTSLAEKEVMLREIHHRVKNNLQVISSLISLQSDNLTDGRIRDELNDVRDRVHSMAMVHEKLYQTNDLAHLNFAEYAASLLHSLWRSHGTLAEKARLTLALEPVALSIEAAVPCGLLLNELAGNALKHAFPNNRSGEVTVGLEHDPATDAVCLRVYDNGIGFPAGLDWRQSSSLGLRLVQILAGQLRGTVETETNTGTEFRVTFPLKGFLA